MDRKAQGALEYLLLIGGAVLVVAIVIALVTATPVATERSLECRLKMNFLDCVSEGCLPMTMQGTPAGSQQDYAYCEAAQPTEITGCPYTIRDSGYYVVAEELHSGAGTCISIQTDNVTIDCQGNSIIKDGFRTGWGISAIGPVGSEITNIGIRNCTITNFLTGISFIRVDNGIVENNTLCGNSTNITCFLSSIIGSGNTANESAWNNCSRTCGLVCDDCP